MTVQAWTFVLVTLSFALYIGVAIWSRAHSTKEFYVAGASVSPLANGMATAADWMSARVVHLHGRSHRLSRLRRLGLPHGLDGRLCAPRSPAGTLPTKVRRVYGA